MFVVFFKTIFCVSDGVIYSDDGKTLIRGNKDLKTFTVPNKVEVFADGNEISNCFGDCSSLRSIYFFSASKLRTVGAYSFYQSKLKEINFLNCTNLTSIGAYSFDSSELETIILPDSVTTFSKCSFAAKNIKTFPFPLNLKSVPYWCFYYAKSFLNVSFKSNSKITTIEVEAFIGAGVRYVHLPASITSLSSAFSGCHIDSITIDEKKPKLFSLFQCCPYKR